MPETPTFDEILGALRRSHELLCALVRPLSDGLTAPSYCDEWTIAQVLSHLGAGAEVFGLILDAGLQGAPAPGFEDFEPLWERWNARNPAEQARDSVAAGAAFIDRLATIAAEQRAGWRLHLFGHERTMTEIARMRLSEVAVHTWDMAVMRDPGATIPEDAASLILDSLSELVGWVGKPAPDPMRIHVVTTAPVLEFRLHVDPWGARLTSAAAAGETQATLRLPAESFVRLVYGRMDGPHTPPSTTAEGIDLEVLRRTFPGV